MEQPYEVMSLPDKNHNRYEFGCVLVEKSRYNSQVILWINHQDGGCRTGVIVDVDDFINFLKTRGIYG